MRPAGARVRYRLKRTQADVLHPTQLRASAPDHPVSVRADRCDKRDSQTVDEMNNLWK
jgi:hypothetical protein